MKTVNPLSATRRANSATGGVIPGISCMITTAGPLPRRKTVRVAPSWVKGNSVKPGSGMGVKSEKQMAKGKWQKAKGKSSKKLESSLLDGFADFRRRS